VSTADSPHSLGRWQDHVRNDEVAARTGLCPVMESISKRHEAIFGHVARMSPNIPAHQALRLQVEASVGRRHDRDWVRSSGRPHNAGSTNSVRTISAHLLTYGEQPSGVVILERRYGPRRLCDDDDDDHHHHHDIQGTTVNWVGGESRLACCMCDNYQQAINTRAVPRFQLQPMQYSPVCSHCGHSGRVRPIRRR